ncbi:MAG: hypothetical protein IJ729_01120, partial [Alloprevotella sp.]|nr:hypothetical protein [Alloprevotella sp.]
MKTRTFVLTLLAALMSLAAWGQNSRAYGIRVYDGENLCTHLVSFDPATPGNLVLERDLQSFTARAAACDGKDYYIMDSDDGILPARLLRLNMASLRIDTVATYDQLGEITAGIVFMDMAYNAADGILYGLGFDMM